MCPLRPQNSPRREEDESLVSWKSIAAFFDRDESTVKRWERLRGLPVHRLPGGERSGVFAYPEELRKWLHSSGDLGTLAEDEGGESKGHAEASNVATSGEIKESAPVQDVRPVSPRSQSQRRWGAAGAALVCLVLTAVIIWNHRYPILAAAARLRHEPNPQAKALYLEGRYYWEHRTEGSLRRAVDAYTQAIVLDSNYAQAYAGLAETYDLMPEFAGMPQAEAYDRAITAANKALSLDDSLAEAHRALAFALFWTQADIPRAFREFDRAIQLDPRDPEAHHWKATALQCVGRLTEAKREIDLAQQLDPASRAILADQAWIEVSSDRNASIAKLKIIEQQEPDFRSPPAYLSRLYFETEQYPEFLEQLARSAALSGSVEDQDDARAIAQGWRQGGKPGMLEALLAVDLRKFRAGKSDGFDLGVDYALLEKREESIRYLQIAFNAHDYLVIGVLNPDWRLSMNGYPPFEQLKTEVRQRFGMSG